MQYTLYSLYFFFVSLIFYFGYCADADCPIFCQGEILKAVQLSGIFNDSKTWVDMPMINDVTATQNSYDNIDSSNYSQLESWVYANFDEAGSDLDSWVPEDLSSNPPILDYITNQSLSDWASDINSLWSSLGRIVDQSVDQFPEQHTLISRPYPMIVPGGRFDETYYWDSYWIVKGLIVCDMYQTAKYLIMNLLNDVEEFG